MCVQVEERTDREFTDKVRSLTLGWSDKIEAVLRVSLSLALPQGSRTASTLSAATLASLGGASSRRGSCDTSFSVETEASIREMKVLQLSA